MQSRFIYSKVDKKRVTIQGLAGTGKTELLLHKLQKLYLANPDSRIAFTCYSKVLARDMKNRITQFFNFMRVEKQIEWSNRLWVCRSWGSAADPDSGLYSYICSYYNLPFHRYSSSISFDDVCQEALEALHERTDFEPCFDYILVDECQDFSNSFFDLCEYVTKTQIYLAGDIFQNIFDSNFGSSVNCDYLLNKCYRTNPHTLMFAHAVGMGLYERPVIHWLEDDEWKACGYHIDRSQKEISLSRSPVRRFGDSLEDSSDSVEIIGCNRDQMVEQVVATIERIYEQNPSVAPDDIAIVFTSKGNQVFSMADKLSIEIGRKFSFETIQGHITKNREKGKLYISNINNVKGLEFPFVICIHIGVIRSSIASRNSIYMALTRSFLTSYFIVDSELNTGFLHTYTLAAKSIIATNAITVSEPSAMEKASQSEKIRIAAANRGKSLDDIIDEVCRKSSDAASITPRIREKIEEIVPTLIDDETEEEIVNSTNQAIKMLMEKYK